MVCSDALKQKGYQIQQYVLEGIIVIENFKYRWNPYKEYLYLIDQQKNFRSQAESNLNLELTKFFKRI